MRPIVVLGLVLAAVAALFFAFQEGPAPAPDALGGTNTSNVGEGDTPSEPTELEGETINKREQIEGRTDAVDLETPTAAPTKAGLTGIITKATLRTLPLPGTAVEVQALPVKDLREAADVLRAQAEDADCRQRQSDGRKYCQRRQLEPGAGHRRAAVGLEGGDLAWR